MKNLDLGKQIGPLPLGAWIAVVIVGVGFALYIRQKGGSSGEDEIEPVVNTGGNPGVGTGGLVYTPPGSNDDDDDDANPIQTNDDWARAAVDYLVKKGYGGVEAATAIQRFLMSQSLTYAQKLWVNAAIIELGAPPVAPADPPTPPDPPKPNPNPKPDPKPKPKPVPKPKIRYETVGPWPRWDSTLWGIADHYYGKGNDYGKIFNANKKGVKRADGTVGMISNPKSLKVGWKLIIP